jgi:co-chaperonin GroES (HSP10)
MTSTNGTAPVHKIRLTKAPIVEPQGEIILIRRERKEESGGILLPDSVDMPNLKAVVVAVSTFEKHVHNAQAGDTVLVSPTAKGIDLGKFGILDDHFLINEAEILAVLR